MIWVGKALIKVICLGRAMSRLKKQPSALIMNQVIEPIVSSGYFCCTENLARRHFIPLLETCAKQNGNNNETFIRLYEEYIQLDQQHREHTMAQSALTITATLEFGYGRRVVLDHYRATIAFLIAGLETTDTKLTAIIAPTSGTTPSSANNTLTVSDLMYDIQYTIKTIHILLSRFDDYGRKLFATLDDTCNEDMKLISTLLNITFNMAAETDVYVKDCSQGAGMAVGAVINLLQDPAFARDLTLGWFFTRSDQQLEACTRTTQALDVAPKATLIGDNGWKNRSVPMLSIVRGLMSCLRQEILLAPFSSELSFIEILKRYMSYGQRGNPRVTCTHFLLIVEHHFKIYSRSYFTASIFFARAPILRHPSKWLLLIRWSCGSVHAKP